MKKIITSIFTLFITTLNASTASPEAMSLKEKIGQLFIVCFRGDTANETSKNLLLQGRIGGFIFYEWSNQLQSFAQVSNLCNQLQIQARDARCPPLFIAIDQEGGRVTRLKKGFYQFPCNRALATLEIPEFAYLSAKARAEELLSAGINMNLAPVIDVNCNPNNPIIGDRSFSSNPNTVTAYAKEALKGYTDAHMIAVVKHFPGHGDVTIDSHLALPVVDKDFSTLQMNEFIPFFELRHETQALMTAHVLFPQIDPISPASKSKIFLDDILRKSWNFDGLVISDSMVMKGAISDDQSTEEACLEALIAGTDIILLGGKLLSGHVNTELTESEVLNILSFIEDAVKERKIDEQVIDQKVDRILKAKQLNLIGMPQTTLSSQAHCQNLLLEREISLLHSISSLDMSQCDEIAKKVWHNETGSRKDQLMFWNVNEDFISLGIGHFIWYPKARTSSYVEDFPAFISYLVDNRFPIPHWLATQKHCPWDSREEFLKESSTTLKHELQFFLENTMDVQGKYLLKKLPQAIHDILSHQSDLNLKEQYLMIFEKLATTHNGVYAMIDYLNFKGSGLSSKERYNEKGWGLLQVVERMLLSQKEATPENFSHAAKEVLTLRVDNSPQKEKEAQWLKGWLNRVSTYSTNKKFD